jgi:hypothetical protein
MTESDPDPEVVAFNRLHRRWTIADARDIGLEPRTTPIESPQSSGMAEAFVRTIKRDYVRVCPRPNAESVMRSSRKTLTVSGRSGATTVCPEIVIT